MSINQDAAVARFLKEAHSYQKRNLSARQVMQEVANSYRNIRISGANLDTGADMLLFQWGSGQHWLFAKPTDLRNIDEEKLKLDSRKSQYLDFTRQVFVSTDNEDADFDESAIQMSLTFIYAPSKETDKFGDLWISSPNEIDAEVEQFTKISFVSNLLDAAPTRILATVDHCG